MKRLKFFTGILTISIFSLYSHDSFGYAATQEEQWAADLTEAKARAKDFKKHLAREKEARVERDKDAHAEDALLKKQAAEYEKEREAYVKYRKTLPTQEQLDAVMNEAEAKDQAKEEKKREAIREDYVKNRNRFEKSMQKEAFISEAQEYDVHSSPSIEWQNAHKPPDLLKFKVEESKNK